MTTNTSKNLSASQSQTIQETKLTNSKQIAGLVGPTLIALNLSEIMNPHIWSNIAHITYLAGSLWFVAGLSILRAHNRWVLGWPVLITVVGWFVILGGLFRMFFPASAQQGVENTFSVLVGQIILLVIGIFLTFKAYFGKEEKNQ
jgi:uncharacterized membrane protein HdeD (DUF308 family)